jgi:hypothetical protein
MEDNLANNLIFNSIGPALKAEATTRIWEDTPMWASSTYRQIYMRGFRRGYKQGRINTTRQLLFTVGGEKLGLLSEEQILYIGSLIRLKNLRTLLKLIDKAKSWNELLEQSDDRPFINA